MLNESSTLQTLISAYGIFSTQFSKHFPWYWWEKIFKLVLYGWFRERVRWFEDCVLTGYSCAQDGPILPALFFSLWLPKKRYAVAGKKILCWTRLFGQDRWIFASLLLLLLLLLFLACLLPATRLGPWKREKRPLLISSLLDRAGLVTNAHIISISLFLWSWGLILRVVLWRSKVE